MVLTLQMWRSVAFMIRQILSHFERGDRDTALEYARSAFQVLQRCGCCGRHRGRFPLGPETTDSTPPVRREQSDTSDVVCCECMCRQTARQISSAIVDGVEESFLETQLSAVVERYCGAPGEIEASDMGLFYDRPPATPVGSGCSRCDCSNCPFCLEEDSEDIACACPCSEGTTENRPVLPQELQELHGASDALTPDVIMYLREMDVSVPPSKTASVVREPSSEGGMAFSSPCVEGLITAEAVERPLVTYWHPGTDLRCLVTRKMHGASAEYSRYRLQ